MTVTASTPECAGPVSGLMLVRSAHPSDADGCVNVLALLPEYFTASTHDEVRRGISDHMALVAVVDGNVVGFILIERGHRRSAEVSYIAVHPAYRNQGIGSLLLAAAVDGLRPDGVVLVEAETLHAAAGYEPYVSTRASWRSTSEPSQRRDPANSELDNAPSDHEQSCMSRAASRPISGAP